MRFTSNPTKTVVVDDIETQMIKTADETGADLTHEIYNKIWTTGKRPTRRL